ncbi:MAG: hypothetical protein MHM6MM_002860 [Cercozoa sp. M6MM]
MRVAMWLLVLCALTAAAAQKNATEWPEEVRAEILFDHSLRPFDDILVRWRIVDKGSQGPWWLDVMVEHAPSNGSSSSDYSGYSVVGASEDRATIKYDYNTPYPQPSSPPVSSDDFVYFAVGVGGDEMRDLDFTLINFAKDIPAVADGWSSNFDPKLDADLGCENDATVLSYWRVDSQKGLVFRRPLSAKDDSCDNAIRSGPQRVAFAAFRGLSTLQEHGRGNAVEYLIDFETGDASRTLPQLSSSSSHGLIMGALWAIVYPAGIICARFFKHKNNWMEIHQKAMSAGVIGTLTLAISAYFGKPVHIASNHKKLGLGLSVLLFSQALLGTLIRSQLRSTNADARMKGLKLLRGLHGLVGTTLFIVAYVQVYLGVDRILVVGGPYESFRDGGLALYWTWLAFVCTLFVVLEVRLYQGNLTLKREEQLQGTAALAIQNLSNSMTWADITAAVDTGATLVVIDDIVYDVGRFIDIHPGGARVLRERIGTDCSHAFRLGTVGHAHSVYAARKLSTFAVALLRDSEKEVETGLSDLMWSRWRLIARLEMVPNDEFPIHLLLLQCDNKDMWRDFAIDAQVPSDLSTAPFKGGTLLMRSADKSGAAVVRRYTQLPPNVLELVSFELLQQVNEAQEGEEDVSIEMESLSRRGALPPVKKVQRVLEAVRAAMSAYLHRPDGVVALLLKTYPRGRLTCSLDALAVGDVLCQNSTPSSIAPVVLLRGPIEQPCMQRVWDTLQQNSAEYSGETQSVQLLLVCTGTGVAPMTQIAYHIQRRSDVTATVIICARDGRAKALQSVFSSSANLSMHFFDAQDRNAHISVPTVEYFNDVLAKYDNVDTQVTCVISGSLRWMRGVEDELEQTEARARLDITRLSAVNATSSSNGSPQELSRRVTVVPQPEFILEDDSDTN